MSDLGDDVDNEGQDAATVEEQRLLDGEHDNVPDNPSVPPPD